MRRASACTNTARRECRRRSARFRSPWLSFNRPTRARSSGNSSSPRIARQRGRALELRTRLCASVQLGEQVGTHARQPLVVLQRRLVSQRIDQRQRRRRPEGHAHRHRAVPAPPPATRGPRQRVVERHDARPVGRVRRAGARAQLAAMAACSACSPSGVPSPRNSASARPSQRREAAVISRMVPAARGSAPSAAPAGRASCDPAPREAWIPVQRDQASHLGHRPPARQHAPRRKASAPARPHPVVARGGGGEPSLKIR